ncbi:MAG: penicillin-binding protein 2 [Flavobacteriales bacterium]|nr:penicillin-binding protein 2 [Flavobacteriales bacterium]
MKRKYDFYVGRKHAILISFCIIFLLIISKLFSIQILNKEYKLSAENNVIRKIIQYPERGWIYDRNQNLLVSNQRAHDIMIVPYQLNPKLDTVLFCNIFDITKEQFVQKLKKVKKYSHYKPSIFLKDISKKKFADIQEKLHLFQGFYAQPKYIRYYHTESGGNIFGYISQVSNEQIKQDRYYISGDLIGVTGLEKSYEKILRGTKGVERKVVDVYGKYQGPFNERNNDTLPIKGKDIVLGLDIQLQEYAELLMKNKRGSVVAIEPNTGEVLCMVSSPSYNPSLFVGEQRNKNYRDLFLDPNKPLYDRSTSALYPPGSIFKLINALIGLQEKNITSGTLFKCNKGWNFKSILHIGCHPHKSPLNLRQSIAQSCNAYFCSTFQKIISSKKNAALGIDNWAKYTKSFGLGQTFDSDLANNKKGLIPNSDYYNKIYGKKRWGASTCISLGIGQDALLMTPVQMANVAVIMANYGYYKTPHLIKNIEEGLQPILFEKNYCKIESKHFKPVVYGMETAIEGAHGTAKIAKLNNLKICGKTGTAENPHGDDHSIFIAFAPKKNPQIAIAVYVENGGWGSDVAVPIGSLCIEKYINDTISNISLEKKMINLKIKY